MKRYNKRLQIDNTKGINKDDVQGKLKSKLMILMKHADKKRTVAKKLKELSSSEKAP